MNQNETGEKAAVLFDKQGVTSSNLVSPTIWKPLRDYYSQGLFFGRIAAAAQAPSIVRSHHLGARHPGHAPLGYPPEAGPTDHHQGFGDKAGDQGQGGGDVVQQPGVEEEGSQEVSGHVAGTVAPTA